MLKATHRQRDQLPDLLRAWAIIGIVLVNVEIFSHSKMDGYPDTALSTPADQVAYFLVSTLFTLKSFSLFSLMFGAGLGYQLDAAMRTGASAGDRYFRRMSGLLILGLLHAIFFFIGDILVTYALLGSALYFCRSAAPRTLMRWGVILLVIQAALLLMSAISWQVMSGSADWQDQMALDAQTNAQLDAIFADGSFLAVSLKRLKLLPLMLFSIVLIQGVAAFGYFLIGLALHKTGLLQQADHRLWAISRRYFFPLGLLVSACGAAILITASGRQTADAIYAMAVLSLGAPLATFGYVGWIMKLVSLGGPLMRFLARGGKATLSAYLMQSAILSFVFLEAGLGLFAELPAAATILIALLAGLCTLSLTSLWLLKFDRGPIEIILRRWTYLERKPI